MFLLHKKSRCVCFFLLFLVCGSFTVIYDMFRMQRRKRRRREEQIQCILKRMRREKLLLCTAIRKTREEDKIIPKSMRILVGLQQNSSERIWTASLTPQYKSLPSLTEHPFDANYHRNRNITASHFVTSSWKRISLETKEKSGTT